MRVSLLLLIALTGCDLVGPSEPRPFITRIVVEEAPVLRFDGQRWDEGGAFPSDGDFSVTIRVASDRTVSFLPALFSDGDERVYQNVGELDLPLQFVPSAPIPVESAATAVDVAVYDVDLGAPTFVGRTEAATPEQVLGVGVDGEMVLESVGGTVRARVAVVWE